MSGTTSSDIWLILQFASDDGLSSRSTTYAKKTAQVILQGNTIYMRNFFCLQIQVLCKIPWGIDFAPLESATNSRLAGNQCFLSGVRIKLTQKWMFSLRNIKPNFQTLYLSFFAIENVKNRCVLESTFHDLHLELLQGIVGQIL